MKTALWAVMLLLLGTVGVLLVQWWQSSRTGIRVPLPPKAGQAILTLTGVRQSATKDGVLQWELDAETAELESKSGRMVLQSPRVTFFLEDGSKVRLSAVQGVLDTKNNDMQVQGNVRVVEDRYTLSTEQLTYKHAERILRSDNPVHIAGRTLELTADRMTYDLESNLAYFEGRVKGSLDENLPL